MMPADARCQTCGVLDDEQIARFTEHSHERRAHHRRLSVLGLLGAAAVVVVTAVVVRLAWELCESELALHVAWTVSFIAASVALTRCVHVVWSHHQQARLRHQIRRLLPRTTITDNDPAFDFDAFLRDNARSKF